MTRFCVSFCNELPDSTGHTWRASQAEVEVESSLGEKQAIAEAIAEFERREHVDDWRKRAQTLECRRLTPYPLD